MKKSSTKVDAGYVGGDVVYQFSVGENGSRMGGEFEGTIVNICDETTADENSRGGTAIEKLICAHGGDNLQSEKGESESDALADVRDRCEPSSVTQVRLSSEGDDFLEAKMSESKK